MREAHPSRNYYTTIYAFLFPTRFSFDTKDGTICVVMLYSKGLYSSKKYPVSQCYRKVPKMSQFSMFILKVMMLEFSRHDNLI